MYVNQQRLRDLLDHVMSGRDWKTACRLISGGASGAWVWKRKSRQAEIDGDYESIFWIAWPVGTEPDWFHRQLDKARERRAAVLASPICCGEFQVENGRVVLERDELYQVVVDDDLGVPVAVTRTEPKKRHKLQPAPGIGCGYLGRPPISGTDELQPSSFGGNKPGYKERAAGSVPSELRAYINENQNSTIDKRPSTAPRMTDLERDLRSRLNTPPKNPNGRPQIFGRDSDGPTERVSAPSNQAGLPTHLPDQKPDYSRKR